MLGCSVANVHFTYVRDGRPSGEAYVELNSEADMASALTKNQKHMGKRYIEGNLLTSLPGFTNPNPYQEPEANGEKGSMLKVTCSLYFTRSLHVVVLMYCLSN